jgi:hypothetical protein
MLPATEMPPISELEPAYIGHASDWIPTRSNSVDVHNQDALTLHGWRAGIDQKSLSGPQTNLNFCDLSAPNVFFFASLLAAALGLPTQGSPTPLGTFVLEAANTNRLLLSPSNANTHLLSKQSFVSNLASTPSEASRTVQSKIVDRLLSARSSAEIDEGSLSIADAATSDAIKLVEHSGLKHEPPRVMFSEDGILALQWERGESGVALIFGGDGVVSIAFTRPGLRYAENGIDIYVTDDVPESFIAALTTIVS